MSLISDYFGDCRWSDKGFEYRGTLAVAHNSVPCNVWSEVEYDTDSNIMKKSYVVPDQFPDESISDAMVRKCTIIISQCIYLLWGIQKEIITTKIVRTTHDASAWAFYHHGLFIQNGKGITWTFIGNHTII